MIASAFVRIFVFALIVMLPGTTWGSPIVFSGSGANAASIQATVDNFRAAVGNPNNGNAPGTADGRREINWDGGGTATTPGTTPFTVFLNNRGAFITTPGTGFVQAPPAGGSGGGLATFFGNATYGTIFTTFSSARLFSASGSNITDVSFFVPGTGGSIHASTDGFGVVFADVDLANTTSIEYFDKAGASLAKLFAATADNGLSFLGAVFNEGLIVDHVRITTGNTALGPNDGGGVDVVAMDDFIFGEPVPEPSSAALLWIALGGLVAIYRRRKKV